MTDGDDLLDAINQQGAESRTNGSQPSCNGSTTRELPNDQISERALLAAAVRSADVAAMVASLHTDIWHLREHAELAAAIGDLLDNGEPVEVTTLGARLERRGQLDAIGGPDALLALEDAPGEPSSARFYIATLEERWQRRHIVLSALEAVEAAYTGSTPAALGHLEAGLDRSQSSDRPSPVSDLVSEHLDLVERRHLGEIVTVPTGLVDLDKVLGGMRLGELYVAAGRPGMGKTVFGGGVALSVAATGRKTLFASLEMSTTELLDRWLGGESRLNTTNLQRGRLDQVEFRRLASGAGRIAQWPLWILDRPEATVPMIRAAARSVKAEFVVVDYLGLITPIGKHSNRQEEVASVARSLKSLARVLDCPVLCLAQLNRAVESRSDKRPLLSDLRESGEVEQSAGVVLSLYRDDYYDDESADRGLIELGVLKNRHGPQGTVKAAFMGEMQRIVNVSYAEGTQLRSV
jgi:replicative DNA helicase